MTQYEVDKAFARAQNGIDTILAFCDHDFREISFDIEDTYRLIQTAAVKYPDVQYINSKASSAACDILNLSKQAIYINVFWAQIQTNRLVIETNIDTFGSQPFFAVKTKSGRYINDNLDVQIPNRKWTYTFDQDSIHFDDIDIIGIATNSRVGSGHLITINQNCKKIIEKSW